jgi:hypothetical protein
MKRLFALGVALAAVAAVIAAEIPELRRYLKVRSM